MDRNLALEFVRLTEQAALKCSYWTGRGKKEEADEAAVQAMREAFNILPIQGTVVIGEGERDEAPMLYIGEKVGRAKPTDTCVDIALDPLEGTNLCAYGHPGALSVIAASEKGGLLHAPDVYMNKIACGPEGIGVVHLEQSPTENIRELAKKMKKQMGDITVMILDRPRHEDLIEEVRSTGARIHLIEDGDVSASLATCEPESGIDLLLGTGGAPEGVISAAAIKCLDGVFQGQLIFPSEKQKLRAEQMGITQTDQIYEKEQLAKGPVFFAATGVTTSPLLEGVKPLGNNKFSTHSVVMRSQTKTIRYIQATHNLNAKPIKI